MMKRLLLLRPAGRDGFFPVLLFYAVCMLALLLQWSVAYEELGGYGSWFVLVAKGIGDLAVLTLPYWFLRPRWRWMLLLPVWGMSLWWWLNLLYFRFWLDIVPPSSVFMMANVDSLLLGSMAGLWVLADLLFLLIPVAVTLVYVAMKVSIRGCRSCPLKVRAFAVLATAAVFFGSQVMHTVSFRRFMHAPDAGLAEATLARWQFPLTSYFQVMKINGMVVYLVRGAHEVGSELVGQRSLTPHDRETIADYLSANDDALRSLPDEEEVSWGDSHPVNVVMVVVESLNTDALAASVGGRLVMPVLNRLVCSDSSLVIERVISQIKDGGSGDGQLIYNSGLLPSRSGSAAMKYGSKNRFNGLAERFNGETYALFAEPGRVWNEPSAFRSYGFATVLTSYAFEDMVEVHGADGAMFRMAEDCISKAEGPFFVELVTASMHVPFNDPGVEPVDWIETADGVDDMRRAYLQMVNYFDRELGRFLGWLEEKGLSESTMVVIAADHCQTVAADKARMEAEGGVCYIPVVIVNGGVGGRIDRVVGQVDLYPTLLQLLGLVEPGGYNGLGRSMLDPRLRSATDGAGRTFGDADPAEVERQREAYEVSDMILRCDYFRQTAQGE